MLAILVDHLFAGIAEPHLGLPGDQYDRVGLETAGHETLHGRAAENAGAGGGIEGPELSPVRHDSPDHEISCGHRCKAQLVVLVLRVVFLPCIPFADAIRKTPGRSPS